MCIRDSSMLGEYNVVETVTRDSTSVTVAPIGDKYENYYRIIAQMCIRDRSKGL